MALQAARLCKQTRRSSAGTHALPQIVQPEDAAGISQPLVRAALATDECPPADLFDAPLAWDAFATDEERSLALSEEEALCHKKRPKPWILFFRAGRTDG